MALRQNLEGHKKAFPKLGKKLINFSGVLKQSFQDAVGSFDSFYSFPFRLTIRLCALSTRIASRIKFFYTQK